MKLRIFLPALLSLAGVAFGQGERAVPHDAVGETPKTPKTTPAKPDAEPAAKQDFFRSGYRAARQGDFEAAAKLLAQVPATDRYYLQAMAMLGWQVYGEGLGRAKEGLPFVQKAYDLAPADKDVVRAYIKTHVLAGDIFDPKDIAREHKKTVAREFEFLVTKPKWPGDPSPKIPRAKLEADLDELEQIFVKCFAYLELRPVDYRGAFDAVRGSLDDETSANAFTLRVAKLISLFCDGHAGVRVSPYRYLQPGFAPYSAGSYQGRVYLANDAGKTFLDPEHPYVTAIDGRPIADWLKVAGYTVVQESPQWHLRGALENLSFVTQLRAELGLPNADQITLQLESTDHKTSKEMKVALAKRPVRPPEFPHGASRRLGDIGYLRLSKMVSDKSALVELDEWMAKFRDTKGLIFDVRGNTGGTKDIVNTLFPYFMKPGAPMRIVELSTYRLPLPLPKPNPTGFMMSAMSAQPVGSPFWKTDAERKQVADFIQAFKPEWPLPAGKFTEWHAMGLSAKGNPSAYYYDRPLIVLQDSSTFSAGDIFVGAFEDHPKTTQMGMPTGGGNGWMETYVLPNSKLPVVLCQSAKFRPNGKLYDGEGIAPDIEMEATPQDKFGETDTVLEAALKRLNGDPAKTPAAPAPPAKGK